MYAEIFALQDYAVEKTNRGRNYDIKYTTECFRMRDVSYVTGRNAFSCLLQRSNELDTIYSLGRYESLCEWAKRKKLSKDLEFCASKVEVFPPLF